MNHTQLQNLADKNEVRIDDHKGTKISPPYYYTSLRNAVQLYFKTFRTNNEAFDHYFSATATSKKQNLGILEMQFLDIENTFLCLVEFQRFFELFIKDLLKQTHPGFTYKIDNNFYTSQRQSPVRNAWDIIQKIHARSLKGYNPDQSRKGFHRVPFRETLKRFYQLVGYSVDPLKKNDRLVKRFIKITKPFTFFDDPGTRATLEFLNTYRDRILHNGNKLPRARFLDFIVLERVLPIVIQVLDFDMRIPQEWKYFTETVTGIKVLDEISRVNISVRNAKGRKQVFNAYHDLLYVAHLKELGRANFNMDNGMRQGRATHEYNYHDVLGRGRRIAEVEQTAHDRAVIMDCTCCGNASLVRYEILSPPFRGGNPVIQWVKCYTCDYHLRFNVRDLHYFNPIYQKLFDY